MAEKAKRFIDWELVEKDYRAGIKTLRQIGKEHGISHTAINNKAKELGWTRDLTEKIQQRAQSVVTRKEVSKAVSSEVSKKQQLTDAETVREYGDIVANVDMSQRDDVRLAMDVTRGQLHELAAMSEPDFRESLVWLGQQMNESGPTANGGWKTDRVNELYQYIISLPGRVKSSKEIAASHNVYIPIQRKMYKLDAEEGKGGGIDELLDRIRNSE